MKATDYGSTKPAAPPAVETSPLIPSQIGATVDFTTPPERKVPPPSSAFRLLTDSTVRNVLLSYFCLAFVSTANDVVNALWMFLDVKDGGIGLTVSLIILILLV